MNENTRNTEISWKAMELKQPSDALDESVNALVAAAEIHRRISRRGAPAWMVVVACGICLGLGFWGSRLTSDVSGPQTIAPGVVIEISAEELPPSFFVTINRKQTSFFGRVLRDVEIEIPERNGGASL